MYGIEKSSPMKLQLPRSGFPLAILGIALLGLIAARPASAQVTFTVTATATNTNLGYTSGNSYTFVYTSNASFTHYDAASTFNSVSMQWGEETTSDDQMWASLGGDVLGTFVRPTADSGAPWSWTVINQNGLNLLAGADTGNIGTTTLDGTPLSEFSMDNLNGGNLPSFALPQTFQEPFGSTGYFSAYLGSYSGFSGGTFTLQASNASGHADFTVTALTISSAAVPEPATAAILAGIAALGFVTLRRRRRA